MDNMITWIAVTIAVASLVKIISERIPALERWSWHISFLGGTGILIVAITRLWLSEPELPPSRKDVQEIVFSAADSISSQLTCRFDSLEALIEKAARPHYDADMWRDPTNEQALCLENEVSTLLDSCLVDLGLGRSDTVIIRLNPLLRNSQADSETLAAAHFLVGLAHSLEGEDTLALASYETALYHNPGHLKSFFALGYTLANLGRTLDIAKILNMPNPPLSGGLYAINAPSVDLFLSLADSLFRRRRYVGALSALDAVLRIDSINIDAQQLRSDIEQGRDLEILFGLVLADVAERENLLGRALEAYVRILELDSLHSEGLEGKRRVDHRLLVNRYVTRGLYLYVAGDYIRARHLFDSVLANDRENLVAIHFINTLDSL